MHMLRLGFQGVELLTEGSISLPMEGATREFIYAVRTGRSSLNEVLTKAGELEQELKDSADLAPPEPDYDWANSYLIRTYERWWAFANKDH